MKEIKRALISVYNKEGILHIAKLLLESGVEIISTGGTADYLEKNKIAVVKVEDITTYPSILGGRVKTLHPKIFGGILGRRESEQDEKDFEKYSLSPIDLVVVDLYPFEEYLANKASHEELIEKIDIGGISLIRAAAKNYNDVVIVPSRESYGTLIQILEDQGNRTTLPQREAFAMEAFCVTSKYDSAILSYFKEKQQSPLFCKIITDARALRYGENPHQKGHYYGAKDSLPVQLHGKEISHNNLLDIESAIELISDFKEPTVAIIKHTNACGCACSDNLLTAWNKALEADPVSAFGGIIVTNGRIESDLAEEMNKLFFEVCIATGYSDDALNILKTKKNRIILLNEGIIPPTVKFRSLLGGVLEQERDTYVEKPSDLIPVTEKKPSEEEIDSLIFANKIVKHSKSNAIVLAKGRQLLASGIGQTSRVDALIQAIQKAKSFNFSLRGAVMASDAFFPFPDCVKIAAEEGISSIIQPGGSIRDNESIEWCNKAGIAMVTTGKRHFKH